MTLHELYFELSPDMYDALVVGGHHPLFLLSIAETEDDKPLLAKIARLEKEEDERGC